MLFNIFITLPRIQLHFLVTFSIWCNTMHNLEAGDKCKGVKIKSLIEQPVRRCNEQLSWKCKLGSKHCKPLHAYAREAILCKDTMGGFVKHGLPCICMFVVVVVAVGRIWVVTVFPVIYVSLCQMNNAILLVEYFYITHVNMTMPGLPYIHCSVAKSIK